MTTAGRRRAPSPVRDGPEPRYVARLDGTVRDLWENNKTVVAVLEGSEGIRYEAAARIAQMLESEGWNL